MLVGEGGLRKGDYLEIPPNVAATGSAAARLIN